MLPKLRSRWLTHVEAVKPADQSRCNGAARGGGGSNLGKGPRSQTRAFLLSAAISSQVPDSCENVDRRGQLSPLRAPLRWVLPSRGDRPEQGKAIASEGCEDPHLAWIVITHSHSA